MLRVPGWVQLENVVEKGEAGGLVEFKAWSWGGRAGTTVINFFIKVGPTGEEIALSLSFFLRFLVQFLEERWRESSLSNDVLVLTVRTSKQVSIIFWMRRKDNPRELSEDISFLINIVLLIVWVCLSSSWWLSCARVLLLLNLYRLRLGLWCLGSWTCKYRSFYRCL